LRADFGNSPTRVSMPSPEEGRDMDYDQTEIAPVPSCPKQPGCGWN
jgi:hypothetical protein